MSNIIQIKPFPTIKHTIDFLQYLPSTAKPITTYNGYKLAPMYWYDPAMNRIIRRAGKKAPYPYRCMRSSRISLLLMNTDRIQAEIDDVINSINSN